MIPEPGRYSEILAGLHERFAGVPGINAFLDYEPSSINPPTLYSLLDNVDFESAGRVEITTYRINHYLVFLWQGREQAAREMAPYINALPDSVNKDDSQLGGRVRGTARVVSGRLVFRTISNNLYAALHFVSETVDKPRG